MQIDSPRHVQSVLQPPVFEWPPAPNQKSTYETAGLMFPGLLLLLLWKLWLLLLLLLFSSSPWSYFVVPGARYWEQQKPEFPGSNRSLPRL